MADHDSDKTHDATDARLREAREKGQVARSHDLASVLILLAGIVLLLTVGGGLIQSLASYTQRQLGGPAWLTIETELLSAEVTELAGELAPELLTILGLLFVVGVLANVLQTGFLFLPQRVTPDWSHVNPLNGLARIFSLQGTVRLGFGLLKTALVLVVAGVSLYTEQETILNLSGATAAVAAKFMVDVVLWTSLKAAIALLLLAAADYIFQRWKFFRDLRMSTQEMREEMREMQGDPQIIARRRQVQRQLVKNRLASAVPRADVVVTNPTELAVAIQYAPDEMAAPIVIAKGAGALAQQIRRLALSHGIPIVENKPLARELYQDVDVNHPIPSQSYAAVAEVLAYVYKLKGKTLPSSRAA